MRRATAVFLDRDGVINEQVLRPSMKDYGPPFNPDELRLFPCAIPSLRRIQSAGYSLFLVSNQPDYAKGFASLEALEAVQNKLHLELTFQGIRFSAYYYCYHHPEGVVPEYSGPCDCRKPKPGLLLKAEKEHGVSLPDSWMVGDRDSDIEAGKAAGTRTILIEEPRSAHKRGQSKPDFMARDLADAADIILKNEKRPY